MALYVLTCTDRPDAGDLRARTRERHLAYLREADATVKLAGALLDLAGERPVGSMLVLDLDSPEAVGRFAASDPYAEAGLFAATEVKPFRLAIGKLD